MSTTDHSYGVIPIFWNGTEWEVFLINQYGSTGDVFWGFPKGHAELGETPLVAAARELFEETGLTATLLPEHVFEQTYSFIHGGHTIYKTVTYYLGRVTDQSFVVQEAEVASGAWLPAAAVRERLTHDTAKTMWEVAQRVLNTIVQ